MKAGDYCLTLRDTDFGFKREDYVNRLCVVVRLVRQKDGLLGRYTHVLRAVDGGPPLLGCGYNAAGGARNYHEKDLRLVPPEVVRVVYGLEVKDESR